LSELIIETRGLTKNFGSFTAVKDLNLKVKKGALYGFLGQMELENPLLSVCY